MLHKKGKLKFYALYYGTDIYLKTLVHQVVYSLATWQKDALQFLILCFYQIWIHIFSSFDSTQHVFVLLHQTAPHCPAIHQASQLSSILFPDASLPSNTEWSDRYNWWPARTVPTPLCSSSHHRCRRAITFLHHCVHPLWSYQCGSRTCVCGWDCSSSATQPIKAFLQLPRIQLQPGNLQVCPCPSTTVWSCFN